MDKHKKIYAVGKMCKYLKVSRNSYYHWKSVQLTKKKYSRRTVSVNEIKRIFKDSRQTYVSPRIQVELMKAEDIRFKPKKQFVNTTYSKHDYKIEKNTLDRQFKVEQLGKVWVSDITHIRVNNKWIYLTAMSCHIPGDY
jgi:putative transposase